jgi:Uma2 family endonuclease
MTITDSLPELVLRSIDATWTYARWERLPDDGNRYEVIDGVLYMTTAPSSFHQWIVQQLFLELHTQITRPHLGVVFIAPIGVLMPGCDPVQPDLVVVRAEDIGMLADRRIRGVPTLLVEVLSPANAETDTELKRKSYARAGVPEYWIVRPAERDVLVYTQPDATLADYTHVERVPAGGTLTGLTMPVQLAIAGLFEGAPDMTV